MTAFSKTVEAKPHSPIYTMHKYFARRPWNVFRELISHYTSPGAIVLDPFCGGGVTVVECLKLGRRAIGVDVNPIATYVTRMEVEEIDLDALRNAFSQLDKLVSRKLSSLYSTTCKRCRSKAAADWIEWKESTEQITRMKYLCPICGVSQIKPGTEEDSALSHSISKRFESLVEKYELWFPRTKIPLGDKTSSLLSENINYFYEVFTKRNLLALSILKKNIKSIGDRSTRDFLEFTLSSCLKWISRQSHLRGDIVEGWAMHAYWIYPKSLEINVWNTFKRRFEAVCRGKRYGNDSMGHHPVITEKFHDLIAGLASCIIMNRTATDLSPIPDESVDAVITDPPYGGNVNYGELADFWYIWLSGGKTIDKTDEVIINKTQNKSLQDYETMLHSVMKECYRVLKPNRCLVSTFNSRDMRVVAGFVIGACRAGFSLHPNGLVYQSPIRAYTTTFHAMAIGALLGDFVFTFMKENKIASGTPPANQRLHALKKHLANLIDENIAGEITEPQLRESAYKALIPFISRYSTIDLEACHEAVDFFETDMKRHDAHFKQLRAKVTQTRRKIFLAKKG